MNILLTGATGFLGFRTLEQLIHNPAVTQILATGRTLKPSHTVAHPRIHYQLGDLTNPAFVDQLVSQVDGIVHAAALSSPWGRYEDFYAANVTTQQNLIAAARKYQVRRLVYISTPSLYFDAQDRLNIKESDPLPSRFINAYAATKREAELELMQSDVPYVILRPRALIGRGDTIIMPRLIKAFTDGKLKIIGDGKNIVDLTSVANVGHAIERSLVVDKAGLNQIYNISNGAPVLLWECIEDVLTRLGYSFSQKKIPYLLVKTIAQLMEWKSRQTDYREPVLTVYGIGTLARSFTMDISKARNLLDYRPTVTTQEAMEEFTNWYLKNP